MHAFPINNNNTTLLYIYIYILQHHTTMCYMTAWQIHTRQVHFCAGKIVICILLNEGISENYLISILSHPWCFWKSGNWWGHQLLVWTRRNFWINLFFSSFFFFIEFFFPVFFFCTHTEKSLLNIVKSNEISIVIILSRLIWQQTEFRLVLLNQSEKV